MKEATIIIAFFMLTAFSYGISPSTISFNESGHFYIINTDDKPVEYHISNYPEWIIVDTPKGTVEDIEKINFRLEGQIPPDSYRHELKITMTKNSNLETTTFLTLKHNVSKQRFGLIPEKETQYYLIGTIALLGVSLYFLKR